MSYIEKFKSIIPLEIKGIEYNDTLQILNFLKNGQHLEVKDENTFPFYLIPLICEKYPQIIKKNGFRLRQLYKQYPNHMAQATIGSLSTSLLDFVEKDAKPVFQPRELNMDYDDLLAMRNFTYPTPSEFYIHAKESKTMAKFLKSYFFSGIKANLVLILYGVKYFYVSELEREIENLFKNSILDPEDSYTKNKTQILKKFRVKSYDFNDFCMRSKTTAELYRVTLPHNVNIHDYHPLFDWTMRKIEICDLNPILNGRQHIEGNPGILMDLLLASDRDTVYRFYGNDLTGEQKIQKYKNIFLMKSECHTMTNIDYEKMRHVFPILYFHKDFSEETLIEIITNFWPKSYEVGDSHICIMAYYFVEIMRRDPFRTKPIPPKLLHFFIEIEEQEYVVLPTVGNFEEIKQEGEIKQGEEIKQVEEVKQGGEPSCEVLLCPHCVSGEEEPVEDPEFDKPPKSKIEHCECEGLCHDSYECQCNDFYCKCTEKRMHMQKICYEDPEFSPYQTIDKHSGDDLDEFEI